MLPPPAVCISGLSVALDTDNSCLSEAFLVLEGGGLKESNTAAPAEEGLCLFEEERTLLGAISFCDLDITVICDDGGGANSSI